MLWLHMCMTMLPPKGPADYWEIYNQNGELLAVSWFDGHGVRKSAVDRGIVEEKDQARGNFCSRRRRRPSVKRSSPQKFIRRLAYHGIHNDEWIEPGRFPHPDSARGRSAASCGAERMNKQRSRPFSKH